MTYCLGIMTHQGLVMASDSRSNAGWDQINLCRKMHSFVRPGERAFVLLASGSLSITQSVITLLRKDFDAGMGLATAENFYEAAHIVGQCIRRVSDLDRQALEKDGFAFNVNILLGGQVKGGDTCLYMIYPQGNPLSVTHDSPYLQIGEVKYGRPILDRGVKIGETTLEVAAMYALLSFDATMRSNLTVGPPIEIVLYRNDSLQLERYRRFEEDDPELGAIHAQWEHGLRHIVEDLPPIKFNACLADIE